LTRRRYEDAVNSYLAGEEVEKAAMCLLKQAKSLEVSQLTENLSSKKLNPRADEFVPYRKRNNNNNYNANKNNNNSSKITIQPILDLLTKAKKLVESESTTCTSFEVGIPTN
jgi:molecular chaperone GrpE (heat shock protein)